MHSTIRQFASRVMLGIAAFAASAAAHGSVTASFDSAGPNIELTDTMFFEGSGFLSSDLNLDRIPSGGSTTVAAGSFVSSYFFEVDRNPNSGNRDYELTLTFNMPIIGVIGLESSLDASALVLTSPSFNLKTPTNNQELNSGDATSINNNVLVVDGRVRNGRDPFRVIVQAQRSVPNSDLLTPEPGSLLCWAGLLGLAAFRRGENG